MLIKVTPHKVKIIKKESEPVNEKEIKISKCQFEFSEEITDEYVKEAYFTLNGKTYKQIIYNNECEYPSEVLEQKGTLEIGVVCFLVENEEEIKRYNPSPDYYTTWEGSLKDAENSVPITPSDKEQIESEIQTILNNTYELVAGENIILTRVGKKIIISAKGTPPTPVGEGQLLTSDDKIFLTVDNANFIVKEVE